jgi:hypothetical protein
MSNLAALLRDQENFERATAQAIASFNPAPISGASLVRLGEMFGMRRQLGETDSELRARINQRIIHGLRGF